MSTPNPLAPWETPEPVATAPWDAQAAIPPWEAPQAQLPPWEGGVAAPTDKTPPLSNVEAWERYNRYGGTFGGSLLRNLAQPLKLPGQAIEAASRKLEEDPSLSPSRFVPGPIGMGLEAAKKVHGPLADIASYINNKITKAQDWFDPLPPGDVPWYQQIPSALGSAGAFILTGAAGRAAGAGNYAPNLAFGGALGASTQYEDAIANGANPDEALISLAAGGVLGTTEALPIGLLLGKLNKLGGGKIAEEIRRKGLQKVDQGLLFDLLKQGLAEAGQEGLQQAGSNWIARDLAGYDPARTLYENFWDSVITGGVVGSMLGGGMGALRKAEVKEATRQMEEVRQQLLEDPVNQIQGLFTPVGDLVRLGGIRQKMDAVLAERARIATEEKEAEHGRPTGSPADALANVFVQNLGQQLPGTGDQAAQKATFGTKPEQNPHWMQFRGMPAHEGIETALPKTESGGMLSVEAALEKQPVVVVQDVLFEQELNALEDTIAKQQRALEARESADPKADTSAQERELLALKENRLAIKTKQKIAIRLTREFKSLVASIREAFGVKDKYIITTQPDVGADPQKGQSRYGYFSPIANVPKVGNAGIVYLNVEDIVEKLYAAQQDPQAVLGVKKQMFESITHEMGHALFDSIFEGLLTTAQTGTPEEAQKAYEAYNYLEQGYRQWLKDLQASGSLQFVIDTKMSLQNAQGWLQAAGSRRGLNAFSSNMAYIGSLDEFFADQLARLAAQGELPNEALTKVFRPLLQNYKDAFEQFPQYAKNEYGGSWLAWLKSMRLDVVIENARAAAAAGGGKGIIDALRGKVPGFDPSHFAGLQDHLDRWGKGMSLGLNLLQIVNENPHIENLGFYLRGIEAWQNYQRDMGKRSNDALESWRSLGKKEAGEVSQVFLEEQELRRRLTPRELGAKLTAESLEVYTQVRAVFDYILDEMKAFAIEDANKTYDQGSEIQKAEVERITKEFDKMKTKGYFPSIRFGKYTITARAKTDLTYQGEEYKEGALITFPVFETEKERNRALESLRGELGDRAHLSPSTMRESEFAIQGMPRSMVRALRNKLKMEGNLTPDAELAFEQELRNLAPFRNFRKQFMRKRGIHGASEDMIRSFAYYARSAGGHIARIKFSDDMLAAIKGLQQDVEVIKRYGGNAQARQEMVHWLQRHFDYIMNPANELAALRGAGFVAYLGFNIKSAFVNATQVPMVTYPYLGVRYGDVKAVKALAQAAYEIQDWVRKKPEYIDAMPDAQGKIKKPNDHKRRIGQMIAQLTSEGIIDQSLATELAIAASENNLDRGLHLPAGKRFWHEFSRWSALPFHLVEKLNRYTTAIATYNLEYARSADHKAAVLRAKQAVRSTQYENARWNRPEIFRGKKSTFFLFANFLQNTLYFAIKDPGSRRYFMMMLLLAGVMGLPGAEDMEDVVDYVVTKTNKALGMKNPKFQLRVELREALEELQLNPDLILHGISQNSFGLGHVGELTGIPIPRLDLSGSIGMGNIIPGTKMLTSLGEDDPNRVLVQGAAEVAGAAGNFVEQYYAALFSKDQDDWKRMEKLLPMLAMRNVSKATRYFVRQKEETAGGEIIHRFNPHDMRDQLEIIAQGLGFMPSQVALGWERELASRDMIQYYQGQAQGLQRQLNWAFFQEDREAQADVRKAISEYNASVPFPEMGLRQDQIRKSLMTYLEDRKIAGMGEAGERKYRRLRKQVEEAYPDPYADMIRSDPLGRPD